VVPEVGVFCIDREAQRNTGAAAPAPTTKGATAAAARRGEQWKATVPEQTEEVVQQKTEAMTAVATAAPAANMSLLFTGAVLGCVLTLAAALFFSNGGGEVMAAILGGTVTVVQPMALVLSSAARNCAIIAPALVAMPPIQALVAIAAFLWVVFLTFSWMAGAPSRAIKATARAAWNFSVRCPLHGADSFTS